MKTVPTYEKICARNHPNSKTHSKHLGKKKERKLYDVEKLELNLFIFCLSVKFENRIP